MKKIVCFLSVLLYLVSAGSICGQGKGAAGVGLPVVTTPPAELNLDPFYKKYVNANGIHIVGSWRVPDSAFHAAYKTITAITGLLPVEVLESMVSRNTRVGIMARYEGTTDIPEHAHLAKDTTLNWDVRARGLGGTLRNPLNTCAEENILGYQIDKYHAEDILVHEFAHTMHFVGIVPVHKDFNKRLEVSLENARAKGKWQNTYANTNIAEYWAEGVQSWFNVNAAVPRPDGKHNHVNTIKKLKKYDPGLYAILKDYFPEKYPVFSVHQGKK